MGRAGIPHMQVIQAATRVAAEAIGIGATVSTIEVGKEADLAACRVNPLTDIRCLNDVVMVVRAGGLVSRDGGADLRQEPSTSKPKTAPGT